MTQSALINIRNIFIQAVTLGVLLFAFFFLGGASVVFLFIVFMPLYVPCLLFIPLLSLRITNKYRQVDNAYLPLLLCMTYISNVLSVCAAKQINGINFFNSITGSSYLVKGYGVYGIPALVFCVGYALRLSYHRRMAHSFVMWKKRFHWRPSSLTLVGVLLAGYVHMFFFATEMTRSVPFVFWGISFDILYLVVVLYLLSIAATFFLFPRVRKRLKNLRPLTIDLVTMIMGCGVVLNLFFIFAALIHVKSYSSVPFSGDDTRKCRVIYSVTRGMGSHYSGELFLVRGNFGPAKRTGYSWSSKDGGSFSKGDWEVYWEKGVGKLKIYSPIGLEPETRLPAQFTCL